MRYVTRFCYNDDDDVGSGEECVGCLVGAGWLVDCSEVTVGVCSVPVMM